MLMILNSATDGLFRLRNLISQRIGVSLVLAAVLAFMTSTTHAGEADVTDVRIESLGDGRFLVSATLVHADTGWDHYANRWDVLDENGELSLSFEDEDERVIVSVACFRAGYTPDDYYTEAEWLSHESLELRADINVPSITVQLVSTKKVQEVLTQPG